MSKRGKRILSLILVLMMLIGMLPLTAFPVLAEEHAHTYENGVCMGCGAIVSPYLQQLPKDMIGCTNLYDALNPVKGYYTATKYDTSNGEVLSVVIPVEPGDRIAASSFASKAENMGSVAGIRVTYLQGDKIVTSLSAGDVYSGYTTNGYITVPDGVDTVCVPWWKPSDSNWLTLSQISKDFAVHSPKAVGEQAPTCTENGYTAGEICAICNVSLSEREEIPATGHNYSDNGCTVCGAPNLNTILNGKYVSILGDSISTFNGFSNNAAVNTTIGGNGHRYDAGTADTKPGSYCQLESVNDTWWMNFANRSSMNLLVNNSWAGSQVFGGKTSDGRVIPAAYLDRCVNLHDNTLENNPQNKPIHPDVIFVYLGINDYNFNRSNVGTGAVDYAGLVSDDGTYVTPTTFGEAYGIMLHKMRNAYPDAQIFVMTLLPENLYSVDKTAWEQHNAYIRAAAEYYTIPVVDLAAHCAITWENYSGYMMDKIHPTTAGMQQIANCIEAELQSYYAANPPHTHFYKNGVCTICGAEHPNLANYEGKVISILGDSISTFAGYIPVADGFNLAHKTRYPQDNLLTDVNETWWMQVVHQLDAKLGINDSWASTEVYNYIDEEVNSTSDGTKACMASTTRIQNLGSNGTPDVIFFFGGTNDTTQSRPLGAFDPAIAPTEVNLTSVKWDTVADAYVDAIMRLQHYYPDAEIIAMLPYHRSSQGTAKVNRYNDLFASICDHYGVPYADLRKCGITGGEIPDGTHADADGMDDITAAVLDVLLRESDAEAGEHIVHSVTYELTDATSSKGYYKGVSHGKSFETTITGEKLKVTVTMGGVDVTADCYKDGVVSIANVTGDIVITAGGVPKTVYDDYLQELPDNLCSRTNLWAALKPINLYFRNTSWGLNATGLAHSVTFAVSAGDRIWATSFQKSGINGGTKNGIALTWFDEDGVIETFTPAKTYAEFAENGYLTAPEGAVAVNVVMWNGDASYEVYILNRDHTYENGVCTGCGAKIPNSISLRYDDHYDVTGKTVEIVDAGKPTSYQVGYGVAENAVHDTAVVTLRGDTLIATGIGSAIVKIDGVLHEVTVTAAPISLLLLIGQSNMRGSEGNANQSIVCPDGMVYSTYGDDRGESNTAMTVSNANHFAPSALTGTCSSINAAGTTDCLNGYPVNSLTEAGAGKIGPDSGFAYEWVKQTGEKVWVVNAAHGGTSINVWQPGTTEYEQCQALFTACQETLRKEIAAGHFTLSHMAYFWCQGCSDRTQSAQWYVNKYLAMHNGLKTEMSFDHDSNAATADKTFEFGGIIPVRVGSTAASYRDGVYETTNPYSYHESYVDLRFSGPRVAQYWMINNPELSDIWGVCNIGEEWVWMPDGTNGVTEYFQAHYPTGTVDYTTQVKQSASWYTPTTPKAVHDSVHYNQIGYNEIGRESVRNALIMLGEMKAPNVETTVELLSWDGYTPVDQVSAAKTGSSATLVVPKVYPIWKSKEVTYRLSDGLTWNYYDLLAKSDETEGTLTAIGAVGSVTVVKAAPGSHYASHLSPLPENVCSGLNLWNVLEHDKYYFANGTNWSIYSGGNVYSVTIPVEAGEKIFATAWGKAGENGHATSNGIRTSFFSAYGVAKTMTPAECYAEFAANGGYLVAPEGAVAVNIAMWNNSDDNEIYILNRPHSYTATVIAPTCTEQGYTTHTCACGDSYVDDYVDTLDHNYSASITYPAGSTKGYTDYTCSVCSDSYRTPWLDENAYEGKIIACVGDSITAGVGVTKDQNDYVKLLADQLGMDYIRLGASGTTLCTDGSRICNIGRLAEGYLKGADVVTIAMGINDFCAAAEGYYELGDIDSTDSSTIYGAVRMWCERIEELRKTDSLSDTQFYFVTPVITSWNNSVTNQKNWDQSKTNIHGYTLRDLCNAIIEVAALYDVAVIDLNLVSGMYYVDAQDNNTAVFGGDGVHPGANGHAMMAAAIANALLQNDLRNDHTHAFGSWITTTWPSCYTGEQQRVCTVCSATESRTVEPNGNHHYSAVVTAPTCKEKGYTTYTCACGDSYVSDYVDATGHTKVVDPQILPTFDKPGLTEGEHCSVCGDILVAQQPIAAKGYDEMLEDNTFKILLIGNSYSQDASNCGQGMITSQMFDIFQAMLGEDVNVVLGLAYSGGKGMHWHATQADRGTRAYGFSVISTDNPKWKSVGTSTSEQVLTWTDWDVVSLQPYNVNTSTGKESVPYPDSTDEKFYQLEDASVFMLDFVNQHAPQADVYCYMHWAQTKSIQFNAALSSYNKMAAFYPQVLEYVGTTSGKTFANIIPVGLSVQNARTTYLALLRYNTSAYDDGNLNLTTDAQIGLQRDGGHLSFNIGRYIAALTFAEIIIPEKMRADGYVLPDIRITESVGKLPKEYTEIVQKAVHAAVDSWRNGSLAVTEIGGYTEDPTIAAGKTLEKMTLSLSCDTIDGLAEQVRTTVLASLPADFAVDAVSFDEAKQTVTLTIRFGYTSLVVNMSCRVAAHSYSAVVTAPTCTEQGYTTHTCACGDKYVDNYKPATGHKYGAWVVTTQPTCTTTGVQRRDCDNCSHYETTTVVKLGHNLTQHAAKAPTCTAVGWEAYETCSRCDYTTYVELPAKGHSYKSVVTAPTCTEQGYTTHICACGDKYVDGYVNALGHSWNNGVVTVEPTEETAGKKLYTCNCCGKTRTEILPTLDHVHRYDAVITAPTCTAQGYTTHTCRCGDSYVDNYKPATGHKYGTWVVTTQPTCTTTGVQRRDCDNCSHYETATVAKLGHNLNQHAAKAPTCTAIGWKAYETCSRCDYTTYVELPAKGHSYKSVVTAPTCTEQGYTTHTCVCGDKYVDSYKPAIGHKYGAWVVTTQPTCTATGVQRRDCDNCNHYETATVAKLGHNSNQHAAKAPTCTAIGWKAYETCSRCDYTTYVELPAKGHSYSSVVTAPTCTKQGYITHTCACGDSYIDSYKSATGHKYGAWVVTTQPTCTATGVQRRDCANCSHYETTTVAKLGHNLTQHASKAPTCTDIGWKAYETCSRCDYTTYAELPAKGHNHSAVITAPTCTEQGYTTHTCACGDKYVDSYTPVTEHIPVTVPGYVATCTVPGLTDGAKCAVCDTVLAVQIAIPSAGHKYTSAVVAPTCAEPGYITYTCTCGDSFANAFGEPTGKHVYDNDRDPDCNTCGEVREVVVILVGDANGDGKVNNRDLGLLQQYLNKWGTTIVLEAMDVNGDGKVNNRDLGLLQQKLNFWGV